MYPILYESITSGTVPNHYGVGVLRDVLSCEVTEERNGEYELTLKYPACGKYANNLIPRAVIKAKPNYNDGPQLFRIYKVGKVVHGSFTVKARHISYDLGGFSIVTGLADTCSDALALLQNASTGYTFSTDKTMTKSFKIYAPSSVRSWLGGKAGSILDIYGPGEYHYDNFNVQFLANRGQDRGVVIRYGTNLLKLTDTMDSSNLVTGVMAFWQSADASPITVLSNTIPTGITLDVGVIQVLDATSEYSEQPTTAQLNTYVNNYIAGHNMTNVKKNIKLDFVQLEELHSRVDLCDTVRIVYEDFNLDLSAKCISTTWDVIGEKYIEAEFGEPKTNIVDTITTIAKVADSSLSEQQVKTIVKETVEIIIGSDGGYVFLNDKDLDGYPDELLIMNNMDINVATKIYKWDKNGLSFSSTGYTGTFNTMLDMNGHIDPTDLYGDIPVGGSSNTRRLVVQDARGNDSCIFGNTVDIKANEFAVQRTLYSRDTPRIKYTGVTSADYVNAQPEQINTYGWLYQYSGAISTSYYNRPTAGIGCNTTNNGRTGMMYVANDEIDESKYQNIANAHAGSDEVGFESTLMSGSTKLTSLLKTSRVSNIITSIVKAIANASVYFSATSIGSGTNKGTKVEVYNGSSNYVDINATDSANGITMPNINLNASNGNITCVSLTQTSSKKVKKNIKNLTDTEAKKILGLRPVTFDFKDEKLGSNKRGFIAEEVKEVIPELVNDDEVMSIDYTMMIPYLVKTIQSQQKEIDELKKKLKGE